MSTKWSVIIHVAAAALVAPLGVFVLAPAYFGLMHFSSGIYGPLDPHFQLSAVISEFAYLEMLFVGLPVYLLLRRWNYATLGAAAGVGFLATWLISMWILQPDPSDAGGVGRYIFLILWNPFPFGIMGALIASLFWLIANFGVRSG
jgi:hypothetical protein